MSAHSVCVPHDVLCRLSRQPDLIGVYCLMLSEADSTSALPLRGEGLAGLLGCSRASAFRFLRRLEQAGVLQSHRRPSFPTLRHLLIAPDPLAETAEGLPALAEVGGPDQIAGFIETRLLLEEGLRQRLEGLAERRGVDVGALLRDAVRLLLGAEGGVLR